ncbi:response regulator [Patulibacter americanus]|uniref:response regulator n=1 Tax=Patulibacter americanus TaxID=588672 RepID=UPI0003B3DC94|nr:response regulator [Patulibacter americanus]
MTDPDAELLEAMAEIWRERRPEIEARVLVIESALTDALEGTLAEDVQLAAKRAAHAISGSAGTFGFLAASAHARELEHALAVVPLPADEPPRLAGLVVDLRSELERGDVPPDAGPATPTAPQPAVLDADAATPAPAVLAFSGGGHAAAPPESSSVGPAVDSAPTAGAARAVGAASAAALATPPAPASSPAPVAPATGLARPELLVVGGPAGRAGRLADEALGRGLRARAHDRFDTARAYLGADGARLVLVDLSGPDGPGPALAFLAEAAAHATTVAIVDEGAGIDRLEIAQAGVRSVVGADRAVPDTVDAVLELRERTRASGTRVLAIDDDVAMRAAVRLVLEHAGLEVAVSDGSEDLWMLLDRFEPDLLLVDIDLPWGHSGIDLCRAVRADPRRGALPVIVLSAATDPDTVLSVFRAGADDYVAKPFVGPELVVRIQNRLERARLLREIHERDALTGLVGPDRGQALLQDLHALAIRDGAPYCLAYLDSDDVQSLNARHGYAAGDTALRASADVLRRAFRGEDVVVRWRGDEFVVAMAGTTPADARERLARVLDAVRGGGSVVPGDTAPRSLSVGLAVAGRDGDTVDALLRAAERASREASDAGGGRIVSAGGADLDVSTTDVVLVEDDQTLAALLRYALEARGYSYLHVDDGDAARTMLGGGAPDVAARVVLLDWDLPGVDGLAVLRAMREHGALERTKVIMLTARAGEDEILQALEAGASDHVAKPFSVPVLLGRVRRALDA